tara:strand:+ start:288 stop:491 length:204 start_codon:yes stop_codon:yes gene_type:complete
MSEVLQALKKTKEIVDRLLSQYPIGSTTRRIELNNDLKRIKDQITIVESFLEPFTVAQLENMEKEND